MPSEALVSLPSPVAAPRSERPDRDLWCRRYDECLDVAVREEWPGFACSGCSIRGTDQVFPEVAPAEGNWTFADRPPPSAGRARVSRSVATTGDVVGALRAGAASEDELVEREQLTRWSVRQVLGRLSRSGRVKRRRDGRYELTGGKRGKSSNDG